MNITIRDVAFIGVVYVLVVAVMIAIERSGFAGGNFTLSLGLKGLAFLVGSAIVLKTYFG